MKWRIIQRNQKGVEKGIPIDKSFESEKEEVRGENFDPVNTNFHFNN